MASGAVLLVDPYVDQDFYVPSFKVLVQDQELRQVVNDVISVSYTDSISEIDSFEMTVNNWDSGTGPGPGRFKYSDGDTFLPWQDVELWMGYYRKGKDERRRMLVGEIVTMTPNFPASGSSTLSIRGLNLLHRFRIEQKTATFINKKDSEIARSLVEEIAGKLASAVPRLKLQVDAAEIERNLKKEKPIPTLEMKEYPINFLLERAKKIGYEISLEEQATGKQRTVTFHYRPPNYVDRPTYRLDWGKMLVGFQPSFQTANQADAVIVRAWDPTTKKKIEAKVTRADLLAEGVLNPEDELKTKKTPLTRRTELVTSHTIQTQEEAELEARKRLRQIAQGIVEGKGKTVGLPDLRAGCKVEIGGLGRFAGTYVVTGTTHTIGDGGYTTDFSARMEQKKTGATA
jgi:uncharacterized protein